MMKSIKFAIGSAALAACNLAWPAGQTSTNFAMPRDAFNIGVADMTSANFLLASTLGDAVSTATIASACFQLRGGFREQVSLPPTQLALQSVVSTKLHSAVAFELPVEYFQPLSCAVTVEPRTSGSGHALVFRFNNAVTAIGSVSVLDAAMNVAGMASATPSGNEVLMTLTGVGDNKRVIIHLNGLNGTGTAAATMGFLVGDVTNSRTVSAADISVIKANQGLPVNTSTFRFDVNANGGIDQTDVNAAKARSGLAIP